jgi:hypothetical protein
MYKFKVLFKNYLIFRQENNGVLVFNKNNSAVLKISKSLFKKIYEGKLLNKPHYTNVLKTLYENDVIYFSKIDNFYDIYHSQTGLLGYKIMLNYA